MKHRIVTTSTFARRLGFKNARDKKYRFILKAAKERKLLKIVQGGFMGDSMHHPKLVVVSEEVEDIKDLIRLEVNFDPVNFIEQIIFPSYAFDHTIDGYKLNLARTGIKRPLRDGTYSNHEWWICDVCTHKIAVGKPYASKVDFSKRIKIGRTKVFPVFCKCLSCFLDIVEDFNIAKD